MQHAFITGKWHLYTLLYLYWTDTCSNTALISSVLRSEADYSFLLLFNLNIKLFSLTLNVWIHIVFNVLMISTHTRKYIKIHDVILMICLVDFFYNLKRNTVQLRFVKYEQISFLSLTKCNIANICANINNKQIEIFAYICYE